MSYADETPESQQPRGLAIASLVLGILSVLGGVIVIGAVLGAIIIGLVRALGSAYIGERWTSALVFVILILILVFKPQGLLGTKAKEKV